MENLLKQLIEIESPSGSEQNLALFLQDYLEQLGWKTTLQPVYTNSSSKQTYNLYASRENVSREKISQSDQSVVDSQTTEKQPTNPDVIFCTHLDCVSPYIPYREDQEYIYGRGACDAKNQIVTMIYSAERLLNNAGKADDNLSVGLLLTAGEEIDHPGIRKANKLNLSPSIFIVGEPTEFHLIHTQKGCINGRITSRGIASHSGYPDFGDDAVRKLIPILRALYRLESRIPECFVNAYISNGGHASNVLADSAEAEFCIRYNSKTQTILDYLQQHQGESQVYFDSISEPMVCDTLPSWPQMAAGFVTDLDKFYVQPFQCQRFIFGSGSILDAHTPDEKIAKEDLPRAVQEYVKIVEMAMERNKN